MRHNPNLILHANPILPYHYHCTKCDCAKVVTQKVTNPNLAGVWSPQQQHRCVVVAWHVWPTTDHEPKCTIDCRRLMLSLAYNQPMSHFSDRLEAGCFRKTLEPPEFVNIAGGLRSPLECFPVIVCRTGSTIYHVWGHFGQGGSRPGDSGSHCGVLLKSTRMQCAVSTEG